MHDAVLVGVFESARDLEENLFGFGLEPRQPLGMAGESHRQDVDGYFSVELGIQRFINFAHAGRPDEGEDLIGSKFVASR